MTTVVLLPLTVYGEPSGNYDGSSLDFNGDAQPAANYYQGRGSLQTIFYRLDQFVGGISIEATVDQDPNDATWIQVDNLGADFSTQWSGVYSANVIGNFTWLRARITDFADGDIDSITAVY
jgi:hypothetical protein